MPRAALALVVLLLAGCVQTPQAPPTPRGAAGSALAFDAPLKLPGDRLGAEPNIATGPDGHVWVIAVGSVLADPQQNLAQGAVNLWHSGDAGKTWERQRDPGAQDKNGTFCSCDTDVDLGPDGVLYITDFWVSRAGNGFNVEASRDDGRSWEPPNFVTVLSPGTNDRQYVIAGRDAGEVYLAYAGGGVPVPGPSPLPLPLPGQGGLMLWRSTDHGRTLVPVATASQDGFIARPRVGPDSTVYYPWVETEPGAPDPWNASARVVVAVSGDRGQTFQRHDVAGVPNGQGGLWSMQMDVGPDGVLHAVWMERVPGGGSVLHYARSADKGASWSAPRVVGWPDGTALLPWISHAGEGRAVVVFYGTPAAVEALAAPPDTRWDAWALVVDGNGSSAPSRVSPWPVKVGTFCPRGAACPQDRELLDYAAIAWRDGWVHVAFAASTLDEGAGPPQGLALPDVPLPPREEPRGGHSTNAFVWAARAPLT